MSVVGLVFPSSLFNQSDGRQTWQSNDSIANCSAANYIARTLRSTIKEVPQDVKTQEDFISHGASKKTSVDPNALPVHSLDANKSVGSVSNSSTLVEPAKHYKWHKIKKGKYKKKLHNDADKENTSDLCSVSSCTQTSSREICSIGQTESDQKSELVSCQTSKEVIHNSIHSKSYAKCNSSCSQSTLNSEESKQLTNSGDFESPSTIHKVSSETSVLQDPTFINNKVKKTEESKSAKKQRKSIKTVPSSAVVRSVTGLEHIGVNLEDARDCKVKLSSRPCQHDTPVPNSSRMMPRYGNCRSTTTSGNCSNRINYGAERWKRCRGKVIADGEDCTTKWNSESTHASQYVGLVEPGAINLRTVMGVKQVFRDGNNKEVQCNRFPLLSNAPTVASSQDVKHDSRHSHILLDSSRIPIHVTNHKQFDKENAHFVWQKTGNYVGQNNDRQISQHERQRMDTCSWETISQLKHNSSTDGGKLPLQHFMYASSNGLQQRVDNLGSSDHKMPRSQGYILVESPEWVAQQKFNANLGQNVSRFRRDDILGNMTCARSKYKLNQSFKKDNVNYYRRGFWISKANLSKPHSRPNLVYKEAIEVPKQRYFHRNNMAEQRSSHGNHHHKSDYSGNYVFECKPSFPAPSSRDEIHDPRTQVAGSHKHLSEIQPHAGTKIRRAEDITGEAFDVFLSEEDRSSACIETELPDAKVIKECITPRVSFQKWIPIDRKDSSLVKTDKGMKEVHQEGESVLVSETLSVTNITNGMKQCNGPSDNVQVNCLNNDEKEHSDTKTENWCIYIGLKMSVQALDAAYNLQIASERVLAATGSPIAEFEKLLDSSSPVIIPSLVHQHCEDIIKYHPTLISTTNFQKSDVSLRDVWSWYERPGNYGLEVKVEESRNPEGMETDVVTFSAHFAPFLSAVQLLGRSCCSPLSRNTGYINTDTPVVNTDTPVRGETEQCSCFNFSRLESVMETSVLNLNLAEKHMRQCNQVAQVGNGYSSSVSALCPSDDPEVIFEYFEHGPPQQRKPLYAKVKDLVEAGSSNPQVFGDPSMLECINLIDLHPASWYSVAWYPIYRIPEGKFRASFLTYHSLGHLVPKIKPGSREENAFCAVFPVLGMQSYNAQGECWFHPKKPTKSHFNDGMPFNTSGILEERLRTLKENAAIFARGHVRKGLSYAQNNHPDYEFFLTRKQ